MHWCICCGPWTVDRGLTLRCVDDTLLAQLEYSYKKTHNTIGTFFRSGYLVGAGTDGSPFILVQNYWIEEFEAGLAFNLKPSTTYDAYLRLTDPPMMSLEWRSNRV